AGRPTAAPRRRPGPAGGCGRRARRRRTTGRGRPGRRATRSRRGTRRPSRTPGARGPRRRRRTAGSSATGTSRADTSGNGEEVADRAGETTVGNGRGDANGVVGGVHVREQREADHRVGPEGVPEGIEGEPSGVVGGGRYVGDDPGPGRVPQGEGPPAPVEGEAEGRLRACLDAAQRLVEEVGVELG